MSNHKRKNIFSELYSVKKTDLINPNQLLALFFQSGANEHCLLRQLQ